MEETNLRQMPYDETAEKAVLGVCLSDPAMLDIAIQILAPDDFYINKNAQIYEAMVELKNTGKTVGYVELGDALKMRGIFDAVGGMSYLVDLTGGMIYSVNIRQYAQIVKDKSLLRQLIRASERISNAAYSNAEEASQVIEDAEREIFDITQSDKREGLRSISDLLKETKDRIDALSKVGDDLTGIDIGFIDINRRFNGFQRSDLLLLAARPGMGKTALGLNFALNAAQAGHSVAVFSLEMSSVQLMMRLVSSVTHISSSDLRVGNISNATDLGLGLASLAKLHFKIDDTPGISLSELRAKCRRMKAEEGLDFVMIDYLQLMTADGRNENRQQEISTISRGLKALAKELNIPILALSQLNRAAEKREGQKPQLSDLRESGAIEQDADIVMLLYREGYYNENSERPNSADLNIAKYRNGATGNIELVFMPEIMKFHDAVREY